ncbi:AAA and adenylate/guanylate cyclase domain-containing protein [Bradyrhizobium zhanjiangense]|uniref:Guanylate cyclase domain-containing protein n=1 Tax=Bradyrhizobium zhanjiangense TaxID=1325107 RepID=A0A4Q0Q5B2_9BRAD|nr:AAA and adenylate/guanylate cyclase domain-containing protein [Bradyrhizobium zhanjiangense]RXG84079.1 hypothetical protein EAS61_40005 [Bradyrhizobium zhanjiangense]
MNGYHSLLDDFLPLKLLDRLYGSEGRRPVALRFPAAVMFVDVSRYTALVEQLAHRGREGLEELPRLLSNSYGRCAEHVVELGGEVLYFAGDSLLAYWDAEADHLDAAVGRAIECATIICRSGNDTRRGGVREITPALHIGIGAGGLWAAALGGQSDWKLIAGGQAVAQAAACQGIARSWSYELSDDAKGALKAGSVPALKLSAMETPRVHRAPTDWLTAFLPSQLRERLQPSRPVHIHGPLALDSDALGQINDDLSMLDEIRPVSAIFTRIIGLNCLDRSALSQHQALCVALQEIARSRGGPLGEFFYDDKGLVFSTAFGARGNFHRDDPRRAVDAAHAISQTVDRLGFASSTGVATGDAFLGIVGSARRRQLMWHGAPINRAARLMVASERSVLCDAPTERSSRTAFKFAPQGTLQLAGLGNMAAVFRPMEPHQANSVFASLVGRRNEMEALARTFEEVRNGGKRLLVIQGEAGIGKSTLVAWFAEELRSAGAMVSVARAERDDRRTSLLPWRRLLTSLLDLPSDTEGRTVLDAIRSSVKEDLAILERLPLLGGVLDVAIAENDNTRHLQAAHRGDATMRLVGDLLAAIGRHPLILILEDSQWLDSASWRLVEWVLATRSSILILLCVRSEEAPEELRAIQRRADAARATASGTDLEDPSRFCRFMTIEELNDAEIRELAARVLGTVPPERELADRISALACGNPLFAEEITLTLKTEGLVAVRDGCWRSLRPLDELRYFEGVERVIRERIDRVEPNILEVLKAAAVIGRSFSLNSLKVLLKHASEEAIRSDLELLVAAQFIRSSGSDGEYEFRHDQIRDVVYGSIPADLRQRFHGTLADCLEQTEAAAVGGDIAALVQHFEAAGQNDKAVTYAEIAAAKALQVGAFREVEAFLSICFSHESRQPVLTKEQKLKAVRRRIQLAEAQYCRGDIHAQGVAVRRALTLAGESVRSSSVSGLSRLIASAARLLLQQLFPPRTFKYSDHALAWEREMARCHSQAAMVDYFELRFIESMRHLIEAVVHAERTGVTTELAIASSQVASGFGLVGLRRTCEYFIRKAEHAAVSLGDPAIHSHVCYLDALWQVGHCNWPAVDCRIKQSQELSLQAGDQLRWSNAQVIRFWSLFYRGDWTSLEETANALLSRAQSSGNIQQEIWALRCKSLCALQADRPREAIDLLKLITSAMFGSADLAAFVSSKGSLALALSRVGSNDESLQAVDETLRLLRAMHRPTSHSILVGISGVCEVLLRGRETGLAREYDQWREWETQALYDLKRYSLAFPVGRAQYRLWKGVSNWLDGEKDHALTTWNQALLAAEELSLRQDRAMISAEMRRRQDRI